MNLKKNNDKDDSPNGSSPEECTEPVFTDRQGRLHQGSLKIDATCADAEVRYPTDIDLLHDGCKVINRYIAKLCKQFSLATYDKSHLIKEFKLFTAYTPKQLLNICDVYSENLSLFNSVFINANKKLNNIAL